MHDEYLSQLTRHIQNDPRIRAAWLEGSLGRGNADRYSDIDLHMLLPGDALETFRAVAEQWLAMVRPLVLCSLLFEGKMINALTVDGLRLDVWLHVEETVAIDPARARVLFDPGRRLSFQPVHQETDTRALLPKLREFWRCIALTPVVIGRHELLSGFQGLGIEVALLTDILMSGYGVVRDRGVKNLNDFLALDTRREIEAAITLQGLTQLSLARAQLSLAQIAQVHGRVIAVRHHFEYPAALEQTVLDYVHQELSLLGLDLELGGA